MLAQRASSIAVTVVFAVVATRLLFLIPSWGVVAGFIIIATVFALWHFGVCSDFFRSPLVDLLANFVPVSLLMILFAIVILGILGIMPWMPPSTSGPSPIPSAPSPE